MIKIYTEEQVEALGWEMEYIKPGAPEIYNGTISKLIDQDEYYTQDFAQMTMEQLTLAMCCYATAIENGLETLRWKPTDFYFPFEELYQWLSPQQIKQFEDMYPNCVQMSYDSALGLIYSQIGELFDIPAILRGEHENAATRSVFKWILCVMTAYNLTAPSAKRSQVLDDNFQLAMNKLTEMKNGASTMANAPLKGPDNAFPVVIRRGAKMLG